MNPHSLAKISAFLIVFVFLFASNCFSTHTAETEMLEMTGVRDYYTELTPKTLKMTGMRGERGLKPTLDTGIKEKPEIKTPIPKPIPIPPIPEIGRKPRQPEEEKPTVKWPFPQRPTPDLTKPRSKTPDQKPELQAEEEQKQKIPFRPIRKLKFPTGQEEIR